MIPISHTAIYTKPRLVSMLGEGVMNAVRLGKAGKVAFARLGWRGETGDVRHGW